MRTSRGYSELAVAKESASITCVWQRLKGRQAGERQLYSEKTGRLRKHTDWRLLAWGSWRWVN